jgi:cell division protein FtsZ
MTLFEVDEAANRIRDEVDPDANIIFGSTFDEALQGKMRVSVVATGIEVNASTQAKPLHLASQGVEPSRRQQPAAPVPSRQGGYTGYERTSQRQDFSAAGAGNFGAGAIPSSILPSYATTMSTARPALSQRSMSPAVAGPMERSPEPQMTVGHTASTAYATTTATARKLDEADVTADEVNIKLSQTQTIQRPAPSLTTQPRAQRHGNSFIPPKPVDPRVAPAISDLFDDKTVSAQPRAAQAAEKPVKKSPSLFERFTMQRHQEESPISAPPRAEASPKLIAEAGSKKDEDELDIPAFLRRQAN